MDVPEEYPDDDYRYVDPEGIVKERIDRKKREESVATGTIAFQAFVGSLFLWAVGMNLTKGWRMAGFPYDPRNDPAEPNPHLVIMGYFAIALMSTLFAVYLLG